MGKQTIFWLVALVLIAAVVYYFFAPTGPYLEGFASRSDAYPTSVSSTPLVFLIKKLFPISIL